MASEIDWNTIGTSVLLSSLLCLRSYRKGSLTNAGCVAAFFVGYASCAMGSIGFMSLITFYLSCTFITKLGKSVKAKIEIGYNPKGHRTAWQVLCNGGVVVAMVCARWTLAGDAPGASSWWSPRADPATDPWAKLLILLVVAHNAACQGDTWSSELGVLSKSPPRLITQPWRHVPAGTNGGVTVVGLAAALAGGLLLGAGCIAGQWMRPVADVTARELMAVCVGASLGGTLVDSVLGALFQFSGVLPDGHIANQPMKGARHICGRAILSNNGVNVVSAIITVAAV
eukprot:CAMPEP_0174834122 /NCGR_PEP_ID=MMETSP1114-20130205/4643_1 /TAXON_ID=312471 /ORGANISM="Neobodo designis, Strain CCAP 1951/1" /LENGTH=284 /DNA_ID=CAMNT_0016068025 /DNA_START=29 /DNA_END=879 /DNA_ORIENTATION=-